MQHFSKGMVLLIVLGGFLFDESRNLTDPWFEVIWAAGFASFVGAAVVELRYLKKNPRPAPEIPIFAIRKYRGVLILIGCMAVFLAGCLLAASFGWFGR